MKSSVKKLQYAVLHILRHVPF